MLHISNILECMCEFTISAFATSTLKCRHSGFFIKLFSALQFLRFSPNSDAKFSFNRQTYFLMGKWWEHFVWFESFFFWFAKKLCVIFLGRIVGTKFRNGILFQEICGFFLTVCVFAFYDFFFITFFCFLCSFLLFSLFTHFSTHFFTHFFTFYIFFLLFTFCFHFLHIFLLLTLLFIFWAFVCFFGFINMMNLAESMHFRSMNRILNRQMCTDCIQMLFYKCSFIQPFNFPQMNG